MRTIKQYINNNKHILILFLSISVVFVLLNNNYIFCDGDTTIWKKLTLKANNYIDNLTVEKAMEDAYKVSTTAGYYAVWTVGSTMLLGFTLQVFEYMWNARLLGSKFLYNFTPLGHVDDISGKATSWLGFRNTSGPLKQVIDTVPYEEFWILNKAKYYLLPAFIQKTVTPNTQESQEPETTTTTLNTRTEYRYYPALPQEQIDSLSQSINALQNNVVFRLERIQSLFSKALETLRRIENSQNTTQTPGYVEYLVPFLSRDYYENKLTINRQGLLRTYPTFWLDNVNIRYSELNPDYRSERLEPVSLTLVNNEVDNVQNPLEYPEGFTIDVVLRSDNLEGVYTIPVTEIIEIPESHGFLLYLHPKEGIPQRINTRNNTLIIEGYSSTETLGEGVEQALFDIRRNIVVEGNSILSAVTVPTTALIASVVGILNVAPGFFAQFDAINALGAAITSPEIGAAIAETFIQHGQPVPEFLRQYAHMPNPQDYLLPGEELYTPNATPNASILNASGTPYLLYIGAGLLVLGGLAGAYYVWRNTGDVSALKAAASVSSFEEEILRGLK